MTSLDYRLVQESLFLALSLACLILAIMMYLTMKGGKLSLPWIFLLIGFAAAGLGAVIQLLESLKILIHEYDLRPALLIFRCGSMLSFLVGLIFFKKGLQ